jgi:uncharacterized protein
MSIAPFHVLAKPIGPICNLDCKYCFYLEKETLYPQASKWAMPPEVLESHIRQYIQQQTNEIFFACQSAEPALGVEYFQQTVALETRYANGKQIHNAFQNNGALLDDIWRRFLAENKFLVGNSIDGPHELHSFAVPDDGEPRLNYLCAAYEGFFRHIDPYMKFTANQPAQEQALTKTMQVLPTQDINIAMAEAGRNDLCPCVSGKKFKCCCGVLN